MDKMMVVGNWKMNLNPDEGRELADSISEMMPNEGCEVVVAPPFVSLSALNELRSQGAKWALAAQNMHHEVSGAFTGEISASMLIASGCRYVILGHSERRHIMAETERDVQKKVQSAISQGLIPILCVGETLEERQAGHYESVIKSQLCSALTEIEGEFVVAYEPVWAIGTGEVATPDQAQEVHAFIRSVLVESLGITLDVPLLYGGSVKPDNIEGLISKKDIDGALVGGASLDAAAFVDIIKRCTKNDKELL